MKPSVLLAAAFAVAFALPAVAQKPVYTGGSKVDKRIAYALKTDSIKTLAPNGRFASRRISSDKRLSVIVNAEEAEVIASLLEDRDINCAVVGNNIVTARLTQEEIDSLAQRDDVYSITLSRPLRPHLKTARDSIGATAAQNGDNLETPFDGSGVLVAVIDQGFYPRHLAFYDANGKTRIKQWWNRISSNSTKPTNVLPFNGDGANTSGGHGTHVANIAAGQNAGNDLQGIAPNASLYFIASSFMTSELLEDMETIAKYAKANDMPYVVNMSFGSQAGPHDGTRVSDQAVDQVLQTYGGFVCASMGNEGGEAIHTMWAFNSTDQKRAILVNNPTEPNDNSKTYIIGEVWEQATGGTRNVTFTPFYVTNNTGASKRVTLTTDQLSTIGYYDEGIDAYNGKHYARFEIDADRLATLANYNGARFGVEMVGSKGDTIHAWLESGYGTFATVPAYLSGDGLYLVGEGAATIPHSIAVGAYTTSTTWYSLNSQTTFGYNGYTNGAIAAFSSKGPWLGSEDILKPTVSAPGTAVESALSQYDGGWSSMEEYYVTKALTASNKTYYYGVLSGTSMAAPMMTGAIALWLQANPRLTYDDVIEIIRTTSRHDNYAKNEWDTTYGYGKVDVYNGLKKALEFKVRDGIQTLETNSTQPVTLLKQNEGWKILFNSNERHADLMLCDLQGRCLLQRHLTNVGTGHEETVDFSALTPGTYVIHLQTPAATYSRKVLIK